MRDNRIANTSEVSPNGGDLERAKVSPNGGDLEGAKDLAAPVFAAIFDMDGTLVDNTPYHFKAWQLLFKQRNLPQLSHDTYKAEISGVPIAKTVRRYFPDANEDEVKTIVEEKQHLYQQEFFPHLKAINGLESFLSTLKGAGVKIALATSSDIHDVDFIFNTIPIRQYFDALITGDMVKEPKPSPQIFLKAAELLNALSDQCVVFEDSTAGLKAGNNANMKVVGITTSHPAAAISKVASLVIDDYVGLNLQKLAVLFQ